MDTVLPSTSTTTILSPTKSTTITTTTTVTTTAGSTAAASTTAPISSPAACDGVPTTDWSCCSSTRPCSLGQGDCNNDKECANGLKCGKDNCRKDFSTTGSNW